MAHPTHLKGPASLLIAAAALLLMAQPAAAQDEVFLEPTEEQIALSRQALEAFKDKDWDRAIEIYQQVIDLAPLNSAYASLGYAYFKAGQCELAIEAFDQAELAPKVSNPPPEKVAELLAGYRTRLYETCPGTVIVQCEQEGVQISVDGLPPNPCTGNALFLLPGDHTITGTLGQQRTTQDVTVLSMSTITITVDLETEDVVTPQPPVVTTPPPETPAGPLTTAGWLTTAAGGALMATALVVDLTVLTPTFEDFRQASAQNDLERYDSLKPSVESQQTLVQGLLISGAAVTATGLTLVILDALGGPDEAPQQGADVSTWVGAQSAGVQFTTSW